MTKKENGDVSGRPREFLSYFFILPQLTNNKNTTHTDMLACPGLCCAVLHSPQVYQMAACGFDLMEGRASNFEGHCNRYPFCTWDSEAGTCLPLFYTQLLQAEAFSFDGQSKWCAHTHRVTMFIRNN